VDARVRGGRTRLRPGEADDLPRPGPHRMRDAERQRRAVLLPRGPRRVPRHAVLRRSGSRGRGEARGVRARVRGGSRGRPSRPGAARHHRSRTGRRPDGPGGPQWPLGPPRAAGRLFRRDLEARHLRARAADSGGLRRCAARRRRGGRRLPAASCHRHDLAGGLGRTVPRSSASTGSPRASSRASPAHATPSAREADGISGQNTGTSTIATSPKSAASGSVRDHPSGVNRRPQTSSRDSSRSSSRSTRRITSLEIWRLLRSSTSAWR
jgi:hypothetical protein